MTTGTANIKSGSKEVPFEIIEGLRKGSRVLSAEGYVYNFTRDFGHKFYLNCRHSKYPLKCKGRGVFVKAEQKFYISSAHNTCDANNAEETDL